MSDQESGANPAGTEVEPAMTGSFSTNGNEPGGIEFASERLAGEQGDDGNKFLADLARAMQATASAEHARAAEGAVLRRQAHLDSIRAREALEAEELRELAKEDVKGIDAWSDGEIKRVKLERERRIASRREQLQVRLEEHRAVIAREVEAVEAAVTTYNSEIEQFFTRLKFETDPVEIARQAGSRPAFPALDMIGPHDAAVAHVEHSAPAAPTAHTYYAPPIEAPAPPTPVAIEPVATEPVAAEPVATEPVATEAAAIEPLATEPVATEPVATQAEDQHHDDVEPPSATPMIGVMDTEASSGTTEAPWEAPVAVVEEPATEVSPDVDESYVAEGSAPADERGEPVGVAAEARVVMPRSTGAGSWLRWPNNSVDRTDTPH